ncbi:hypothetical protein B0H14DRAFT_2688540 [Mycena olivaceomarginata]|nr:hypothetical protein B0H14DRAFT_2688540 [Mycena olivaceomarginata]
MAQCPPTPIATRRAQRHASQSRQDSDELNPVPKDPFSRRSVSFRLSNSPDTTAPKFAGYMRSIDGDMPSPSHTDLDSPSLTPKARVQSYSHPSHLLNRAEEIAAYGMREKENHVLSFPLVPTLRASGATPASCSTVQTSWTSKYLTIPIEEYQLEDDDAADVPPISSSPSRFSDPYFPSHELSSPRTSNPDSPVLESKASPVEVAQTVATDDGDFVSNLHALLAVAAQQRALHVEIDNAIADTLEDRSLSVTPDYCPSSMPAYGKDVFGPRIAQRAPPSWSSADSAATESCDCSDCARSRSASRTESIASNSTYTGYAADIDSSPAPVFAPQAHFSSRALTQFRASATTTQQLIATYSTSPFPSPFKRSSSSLGVDYTTPPNRYLKKSKPISRPFSFPSRPKTETFDNTALSRVPASLRKSLSLRSSASDRSPPYEDWITTAPHTPTPREGRLINPARAIPFDVPIIAPPSDHIARLPLSKETAAKIRIRNFLLREAICRTGDELDRTTEAAAVSTSVDAELDLYEDEGRRELERLRWEHVLGIGSKLREEIVHWILDVLPKKSVYIPPIKYASHRLSSGSDRSSSSFSSAHDFGDKGLPDLIEQLLYSPETRFHAAYMFTRYWYLLMGDRESKERIQSMQEAAAAAEDGLPEDPSIPVKMHRDFLEPLAPVYSWEFEAMAPHQISYEDLEIAQRDVLEVFDFRLGATPQPILDELWIALPSLQQLLDFKNGWKFAQKEAWWRLFDAVTEPDVLKFPISLLTVAVLAEALAAALVSKYEYDATVNSQVIRRRPNKDHPESKKHLQKLQTRAEKEMEGQTLKFARTWIRASLKD